MATTTLTKDSFAETIRGNNVVFVDFWAAWCGPCQMFAPVYEQVAAEHPDAVFGKVDTEAEPELAAAFQVMSIPTLMAFREGVLVFAQAGALPPAALRELVGKVEELDMDEVHRAAANDQ
jgi:thioredoxin 1